MSQIFFGLAIVCVAFIIVLLSVGWVMYYNPYAHDGSSRTFWTWAAWLLLLLGTCRLTLSFLRKALAPYKRPTSDASPKTIDPQAPMPLGAEPKIDPNEKLKRLLKE